MDGEKFGAALKETCVMTGMPQPSGTRRLFDTGQNWNTTPPNDHSFMICSDPSQPLQKKTKKRVASCEKLP